MERRRTIRLMTGNGLVSIGRDADAESGAGGAGWPLRDISEGGLSFAVSADDHGLPAEGETVVVTVDLDGGQAGPPLELAAAVRRVKEAAEGEREVSLQFVDVSPSNRERRRGTVIDLAMEQIERTHIAPAAAAPNEGGRSEEAKEAKGAGDGPETERLGDILVSRSSIPRDELDAFVREDFDAERPIGRQLVSSGLVAEAAVARALAEQAGLDYAALDVEGVTLLNVRRFGMEYLVDHLFVPLRAGADRMKVAAAAPLPRDVVAEIEQRYRRSVTVVIASERQVLSAVRKAFQVSRNRRRAARIPAGLSVHFRLHGSDWKPLHEDVLSGLTRNVSADGILFVGPAPADVELAGGMRVALHLRVPDQPEPVRAPCDLVRVTPVREGSPAEAALFLYGVRVLGLSDEDRKKLNRFRLGVSMRVRPGSAGGKDAELTEDRPASGGTA